MTRIIMHGCNGKMGQVITNLLKDDENAMIVAGVDPYDDGHNAYPVFSSFDSCVVKADVIFFIAQNTCYIAWIFIIFHFPQCLLRVESIPGS